MNEEEIRIRSIYLFLACSRAVEQFKTHLSATFTQPPLSATVVLDKLLTRELGLLFRYWTTRQIWQQLEQSEPDAKALNLALLRLFTHGLKLPRDGSGLRYAELSTLAEEVRELNRRIVNAMGMEYPPLAAEVQRAIGPWREAVATYTTEALRLPLEQLSSTIKLWAERLPQTSA